MQFGAPPVAETQPQQDLAPQNRTSCLIDLAILWAIPLIQAIINDAWLYSPIGWLDPWYYLGYGLDYSDPTFLDDYYKASRLPWILVEFAARHIFNPVVASWVLQLGTLALGSTCLYFLFSRTLGRGAAFVGAALFAAFPFAHANGGADYQNVLAGPLYALTWWLALRTADLGLSPIRLFWAGAAAAATIHTNIVFASLLPIMAFHFFWAYREKHKRLPALLESAIWPAIGAVAITFVLAVINWSVGRHFLFFLLQFHLASSFVADPSYAKSWWQPWSTGWYLKAFYLGPFAAALLLAPVTLVAAKIRNHSQVMIYSACYILAASLWIIWQSVGQVALNWFYFAYPLVLPFVGFIAATFAFWAPRRPLDIFAKLAIPIILIGTLATFESTIYKLHVLPQIPIANDVIFGLIFGAIIFLAPRVIRFWAAVVALSVFIGFGTSWNAAYALSKCPLSRAFERAIDGARRIIRAEQRANGLGFSQVFLWAERDEKLPIARCPGTPTTGLSSFEASLTATGFRYLEPPWGVARTDQISQARIKSTASTGALIVFITNNADHVDQLMQRYSEIGSPPTDKRSKVVDAGMLQIPIHMFLIRKKK